MVESFDVVKSPKGKINIIMAETFGVVKSPKENMTFTKSFSNSLASKR